MNNHQLNNLSVSYSGDNGTYHLAGRYDIGSNGKITRIDVSAYMKQGEANVEVGKLLSDENGENYIFTPDAKSEGLTDAVFAALQAAEAEIAGKVEQVMLLLKDHLSYTQSE